MMPLNIREMLDKQAIKEAVRQFAPDFKESSKGLNFRCVLCGDSKKSKSKRRGWVLYGSEHCVYFCHNCGASMSLRKFLKENYPDLHKRLFKNKTLKQMLSTSGTIKYIEPVVEPPTMVDCSFKFQEFSFGLFEKQTDPNLMELQLIALHFCKDRKIPKEYYKHWRVCYDGEFKNRLLIPFFDSKGEKIYAFQGRDLLNTSHSKYTTHKPEGNHKVFNLERVDVTKPVYVLEGPVDAMFLDNAIATAGLAHWESLLYDLVKSRCPKRVWVFDNDEDGIKETKVYAENGEAVFCWPKKFKGIKDINQLFLEKVLTKEELHSIVANNTHKGVKALMKLKVDA